MASQEVGSSKTTLVIKVTATNLISYLLEVVACARALDETARGRLRPVGSAVRPSRAENVYLASQGTYTQTVKCLHRKVFIW